MNRPAGAPTSDSGPRKFGAWLYGEKRDRFTDKISAWVSVKTSQSALAIKCDEPGSIYVMVFTGAYVGAGSYETRSVLIRRDNDAAEEQRWEHDAKFALILDNDKALEFANSLVDVERLAVRVLNYEYKAFDMAFELGSETKRALDAVYEACEVNG